MALVVEGRAPSLGLVVLVVVPAAARARGFLTLLHVARLVSLAGFGGVLGGAQGVIGGAQGVLGGTQGVLGCAQGVGVLAQDIGVLAQGVGVLAQGVGVLAQGVGVLGQSVGVLTVRPEVGGKNVADATCRHRYDHVVVDIPNRDHHVHCGAGSTGA